MNVFFLDFFLEYHKLKFQCLFFKNSCWGEQEQKALYGYNERMVAGSDFCGTVSIRNAPDKNGKGVFALRDFKSGDVIGTSASFLAYANAETKVHHLIHQQKQLNEELTFSCIPACGRDV